MSKKKSGILKILSKTKKRKIEEKLLNLEKNNRDKYYEAELNKYSELLTEAN